MKNLFILSFLMILLSSCATIFGGSKYYAHVKVNNGNPEIYYQNKLISSGEAIFKVRRQDADDFTVILKQANCKDQIVTFSMRKFRWWFLLLNPAVNIQHTIPIPFGIGFDLASGAFWKPNTKEKGVSKIDHKNYQYEIAFNGCQIEKFNNNTLKDSTSISELNLANAYYDSAKIEYLAKHYSGAILYVNKSIQINNANAKSYNLRGIINYKFKKYGEAMDDYDRSIALDLKNVKAYENRGILKRHLYDKLGACNDFTQAITLGSKDAIIWDEDYCK